MKRDKETQKALEDGMEFARLVDHPSWNAAKRELNDIFILLDSWTNLPDNMTPAEKMMEMEKRQAAIALVQTWIFKLEGKASQAKESAKAMVDRTNSRIVNYLPVDDSR